MRSMANVDGVISPAEEAKISVLDRGFLYGDSIYEVFRTYEGVPFLYREHMDRLANSARLACFSVSQSEEELLGQMRRTAQAANLQAGEEIYVRLTITRGTGPIDLDPNKAKQTSFVIIVKEIPKWNPEHYRVGVRLAVTDIRRNPLESLNPNIKGGNYLNNVLAVEEAVRLGADDAVMCNVRGYLTEASNSNILFVSDGKVLTPDLASGNLNGTTKNIVAKLCREAGIEFQHTPLRVDDVTEAAECFIASATREVMPVRSLRLPHGHLLEYPEGGGAIVRDLRARFKAYVHSYVEQHRSSSWTQ